MIRHLVLSILIYPPLWGGGADIPFLGNVFTLPLFGGNIFSIQLKFSLHIL